MEAKEVALHDIQKNYTGQMRQQYHWFIA